MSRSRVPVAVLAVALLLSLTVVPVLGAAGPIKIGVLVTLTGDKAANDVRVLHGLELAQEEINVKGGIKGRKIEFIKEDTQGSASGAVAVFQRITSQHPEIVAIMGLPYSVQALAVEPYVKEIGIPIIFAPSNPLVTARGNPWVFRIRSNDATTTAAAAKYAVEVLNAQRIGVLHPLDEYGISAANLIKAALSKLGKPPVAALGWNSGDKDFSGQILNLKKEKIDTLISWAYAVEGGLILRQMRQMGLNVKILGNPGHGQPQSLDLARETAEGMRYITEFVPTSPSARVQEFVKKYAAKFSEEPDFNSACYYDGLQMLAGAIERVGDDKAAIRDELKKIKNYEGVMTTYSFDENGDSVWQMLVAEVQKGNPVVIGTAKAR